MYIWIIYLGNIKQLLDNAICLAIHVHVFVVVFFNIYVYIPCLYHVNWVIFFLAKIHECISNITKIEVWKQLYDKMTIPLNELKIKDKFINYIQVSYSYNMCHVVLNQLL